mmetsp:Transcript_30789/g.52075  ORF Transcript_30789/g.52075 Transcript_30789/m.52075 type:complete len:85 (+) Transcript_30789:197-451(+)
MPAKHPEKMRMLPMMFLMMTCNNQCGAFEAEEEDRGGGWRKTITLIDGHRHFWSIAVMVDTTAAALTTHHHIRSVVFLVYVLYV